MKKMTIKLTHTSYNIFIENNILSNAKEYISQVYKNKKIYILSDDVVAPLYLDKLMASLKDEYELDYVIVPHGEQSKSIETYIDVCKTLIDKNIRRNNLLIALGGGVIGDLTGFVASSLFRGIPYVGIPTSLLSQMDSSIGGKTGIDFHDRKNILGAFYQPKMVLIDPQCLKTLDAREFNNGMGELIKHGAIGNKALLDMLQDKPEIDENIIFESLSVKQKVVELDEFDQGDRMKLNFGHTFGHAIELKYGYKHGEAVAVGMLMALKMGIDLGVTDKACYNLIYNILLKYNLPVDEYDYKEYFKEIINDKKNLAGVVNFIFLTTAGNCTIYKVSEDDLK